MAEQIIELIYKKYYETVFRYCRVRLNGDLHAAQDCTQEVFLVLHKKLKKLVDLDSILPWLYQTADREIKNYRRKHPGMIDIDEIADLATPQQEDSPLDILDEEERKLVELYYGGADKYAIAKNLGISLGVLYKRMHRIRQKLKDNLDNTDK